MSLSRILSCCGAIVAVPFLHGIPLHAETLDGAIVRACRSSPRIRGEGFGQQANVENVAISRAGGLPSATINSDLSNNLISAAGSPVDRSSGSSPSRNLSANPRFAVPIYLGGAIGNQVEAARGRVASGREVLRDVESDTILRVVTAYMDVLRDGAIVESRKNNARALEANLKATESRFEVGDLTRTDVAQSQARLAQARTQLTTAEAQVTSSRERYREEVGVPSSDLVAPPMLASLPRSADEALVAALEGNPVLAAARLERGARRSDVLATNAVRLPTVNVVGNVGFNNYLGSYSPGANPLLGDPGQTRFGVTGGLEVGLPVFQGGRPGALSRQASAREGQSIEQVTSVERDVITQVRTAFASWQAAVGTTIANKAAIDANRVSLEGVRAENSVGTRTVLDVLNAEQELTNSNVALISAERDAYVAAYSLLISEGLKGRAGVMPITNCDAFRD